LPGLQHTPAEHTEGEVDTYCINIDCPARLWQSLLYFSHRGVMNIEGLGDAMAVQLLDSGLVKSIADLYTLTEEQLLTLERVGKKSAQALLARSKNRNKPASRACSWAWASAFVGERTAELLAQRIRQHGSRRKRDQGRAGTRAGSRPQSRRLGARVFSVE
jgi:DNA ligase (NAD+)